MNVIFRKHNTDTDLFRAWTCLTQLTMNLELAEPSSVVFSGAIDIHHRGIVQGVIGYAVALSTSPVAAGQPWPTPAWNTPPGDIVPGSINGGNILSETAHYGKGVWSGCVSLPAGRWQVRAYGNSHSSLAPTTDGLGEILVEGGNGLNGLIAIVVPT